MGSTALAISGDKIPAHINLQSTRGNENVGNNVEIPRIKLLQKMNKEVDEHSAEYVEGAKAGLFMNSVTGEMSKKLYCLSVTVKSEWAVWLDRNAGKGNRLLGKFDSAIAAREAINNDANPLDWVTTEQDVHLLLIKDEKTGAIAPATMEFANTKLRVSRSWNSQIGMKGGDRFSALWEVSPRSVENAKGSYLNLDITCMGWAQTEDYEVAEKLYSQYSA
jgi:hypothetical protein